MEIFGEYPQWELGRCGAFEEAAEMAEDTADQLETAGTALERTVANSLRIFAERLRKKANP